MKNLIAPIIFLLSLVSFSQENYKKQLDSLITVHKVCEIESNIKKQTIKLDSLVKLKEKYNYQLQDINSFKIGRTNLQKEKQLNEINDLIKNNNSELDETKTNLLLIANELKLAKEEVKKL